MVERKAISKKIRFEVFKRDKFTCQYCGQKAPDIVLQVDHINPVAAGGDNDIVNLITSCFECNNGKRDKKLDDNSVVEKQRKQLEMLQERREQIELMLEWKTSLSTFDNDVLDMIVEYVNSKINPLSLNDTGRNSVSGWLKKFKVEKILDGIDDAAKRYIKYENGEAEKESAELFLSKIGGVIVVKDMPPVNQKLAYVKGIARNRFGYWDDQKGAIILNTYLTACRNYGWNEETILEDLEKEVIPLTKNAKNWSEWKNSLDRWTDDINNWKKGEENDEVEIDDARRDISIDNSSCAFCSIEGEKIIEHSLDFTNQNSKPLVAICDDCLESEKEFRKAEEKKLLEYLRLKKFGYNDVSQIAFAIDNMKDFHIPGVMASVISWTLQDEAIMNKLCEMYFSDLAERRKNQGRSDDLPF